MSDVETVQAAWRGVSDLAVMYLDRIRALEAENHELRQQVKTVICQREEAQARAKSNVYSGRIGP